MLATAKGLLLVLAVALGTGCATSANDPRDPWEGLNRGIDSFNQGFDEAIAQPVATAYRDSVHNEIRSRVRNFFSNLADPLIGVNNFLQGKIADGIHDWARFAFNTTIGLFGIHDVASDMGIDKRNEDFGQTIGRWGVGPGAYLVLPILGSSSIRDGIGTLLDIYTDPVGQVEPIAGRNALILARGVQSRADLLDASRLLEEAALDRYVFQREAYFQRRRSLVYDGQPPREDGSSSAPGARRAAERAGNVFLPRAPRNYEAVLAAEDAAPR